MQDQIVRPYSRIQTTCFDFNLNNEIAVIQEPLSIRLPENKLHDFKNYGADQFLSSINKSKDTY